MKYKFVRHWSGMVLYVYANHHVIDLTGITCMSVDYMAWCKATDTEAYEVMCLLNKDNT